MSTQGRRGPEDSEQRLARLLGAMSKDAPRPGAKRATLTALGLGAATVATTGSAGALGGMGALAKLAATGALFGFATGGAVLGIRHVARPAALERPDPTVEGAPAAPATAERRGSEVSPLPETSSSPGAEPSRPAATPARPDGRAFEPAEPAAPLPVAAPPSDPAAAVAAFDAAPVAASSLREETAQLDRARALIVAGSAQAGLAALDRYATAFPRGALGPEATLLRIKALVASGDRSRASVLARAFMAARPGDPHIDELRALLEP
jgi:hypothetical protein